MLQDHILCWVITWLLTWSCADALEARFTCREKATLYLDGEYSLTFNWTHWMVLPDDVLDVAIACHSNLVKGGLMVSMSNGIVSDSKWKCLHYRQYEWFMSDFDDSQWPAAHEFNKDDHELAKTIDGVDYPPNAKWIWREGGHITERLHSVYCRRRIGTVKVQVRCDDQSEVYVDGEFVGSTSSWTEVWKSSITQDATLFAVKCLNNIGPGGLIASFSNDIVSNRHWKCGYSEKGWSEIGFDDSAWNYAEEIKSDSYESEKRSGFPPQSQWIWVAGTGQVEFREMCCRALLQSPELYVEINVHTDATVSTMITLCCLLAVAISGCITFAILYFTRRRKGKPQPKSKPPQKSLRERKLWRKLPGIRNTSDPDDSDGSLVGLLITKTVDGNTACSDYTSSDDSAYIPVPIPLDPSVTTSASVTTSIKTAASMESPSEQEC